MFTIKSWHSFRYKKSIRTFRYSSFHRGTCSLIFFICKYVLKFSKT